MISKHCEQRRLIGFLPHPFQCYSKEMARVVYVNAQFQISESRFPHYAMTDSDFFCTRSEGYEVLRTRPRYCTTQPWYDVFHSHSDVFLFQTPCTL